MSGKHIMIALKSFTGYFGFPTCLASNLAKCVTTSHQRRFISLDKLSNKRITRLETDIELGDCEQFKGRLINRNPRNLEQMAFGVKPKGFWLEKSPPQNRNKLVFEQSGRQLVAYLQHWSGRKIVEASTKEPKLQKYFRNPNTVQAATIIAQVIARRCLQSGYLTAGFDDYEAEGVGQKTKVFFDTVAANGVTLNESPEIQTRSVTDL